MFCRQLRLLEHELRRFLRKVRRISVHRQQPTNLAPQVRPHALALGPVEPRRNFPPEQRKRSRQQRSRPVADALRQWLAEQRGKVPEGSATAKAIDYSLKRWRALTRFIDDGDLPADNNWVENQIRPIALGRSNWLFAGSLRAGQRAAAIMSLLHSARLNGHEPHAYFKDVLQRLPTLPASRAAELLPHRWSPSTAA